MSEKESQSHFSIEDLVKISVGKYLLEVNVLEGKFDEVEVDKIIAGLNDITGGKEYLVLVNADQGARVTFWGLRKLAGSDAMKYALAKAYVLHSTHHKVMAELFMAIYRPARPIRFFKDRDSARHWLEQQIDPELP